MKLEVVKGTAEEFEKAIACPEGEPSMDVYKTYVKNHLAAAEAEGKELICFRSFPLAEKASDNFTWANWVEQAVKEFQNEHELPKVVRIVADSDAAAEQYKVVYNMFYAFTKADRLQDDKWD